jgi:hypothetical protein
MKYKWVGSWKDEKVIADFSQVPFAVLNRDLLYAAGDGGWSNERTI